MIHIINLASNVTSQILAKQFNIPIAFIVLYPYFRVEKENIENKRSHSEAWIKQIRTEEEAIALAGRISTDSTWGTRLTCEVLQEIPDPIELCTNFLNGFCNYANACEYKHYCCENPDTCDNSFCWFGHSKERQTKSKPKSFIGKRNFY